MLHLRGLSLSKIAEEEPDVRVILLTLVKIRK